MACEQCGANEAFCSCDAESGVKCGIDGCQRILSWVGESDVTRCPRHGIVYE